MKNLLLLFTGLVLFASCDPIDTAEPTTTTTDPTATSDVPYKIENTTNDRIYFRYFKSLADFYKGENAVYSGNVQGKESTSFKLTDFSSISETDEYYMDWYATDRKNSADVASSSNRKYMVANKTGSDTVVHKVGTATPNYERSIIFDKSFATSTWTNEAKGSEQLRFSRNGTVVYTKPASEGGTDHNANYNFSEGKTAGKDYIRVEVVFPSGSGMTSIFLLNGGSSSATFGSSRLVESNGGVEGRIFKRLF